MIAKDMRDDLSQYIGEYESFLDYAPIIFQILEDEIHKNANTTAIALALAYAVKPLDILPIKIYGPYGYIPHIIVGCAALKELEITVNFDIDHILNKCDEIKLTDDEWNSLQNYIQNIKRDE